jgi:hypothetical protein
MVGEGCTICETCFVGGEGVGATATFSIYHTRGLCFSCEFWHGGGHKNKQVVFHIVALPFTLKKL